MKLTELKIEELNSLLNLLSSFNDHVGKQMRLNIDHPKRYNQWFNINDKVNEKIKLVYAEINKRIENITE